MTQVMLVLFKYSVNKWSYISKPSVRKSSYLTSNVSKPNFLILYEIIYLVSRTNNFERPQNYDQRYLFLTKSVGPEVIPLEVEKTTEKGEIPENKKPF